MSPVLEMARLSGGGHVMDAWEDKAPTFPGSSSVGGGEQWCLQQFQAPQTSHPMGEEGIESGLVARWHFDFVCSTESTNSESNTRLCFRPAMAQARKPPTQCGYAGEYTKSNLRFMLAENSLRRRSTRSSALPSTLVNMSVFAMPRTSPLREGHIYSAVETQLQPSSSTSTTILFSIPGQQLSSASSIAIHSPQR